MKIQEGKFYKNKYEEKCYVYHIGSSVDYVIPGSCFEMSESKDSHTLVSEWSEADEKEWIDRFVAKYVEWAGIHKLNIRITAGKCYDKR